MGDTIPMPVPTDKLRNKVAYLTDNPSSYILRYHHISTIQHAIRKVPVVSAMNVHAKYRYTELGKGTRTDKWYRDDRIDKNAQLDDAFYAKSGFDKGHLARREDAEWGTTVANAKLAADMTCSYANAAPQVPALNRNIFGYKGLWGQLEMLLLESGVKKESGKYGRVCMSVGRSSMMIRIWCSRAYRWPWTFSRSWFGTTIKKRSGPRHSASPRKTLSPP